MTVPVLKNNPGTLADFGHGFANGNFGMLGFLCLRADLLVVLSSCTFRQPDDEEKCDQGVMKSIAAHRSAQEHSIKRLVV